MATSAVLLYGNITFFNKYNISISDMEAQATNMTTSITNVQNNLSSVIGLNPSDYRTKYGS